jgi:hypothetical protein
VRLWYLCIVAVCPPKDADVGASNELEVESDVGFPVDETVEVGMVAVGHASDDFNASGRCCRDCKMRD